MSESPPLKQALRTPAVFLPIVIAVIVIIVWLIAFFFPQGSKLSKLNGQVQTLQQAHQGLEAKLISLRHINIKTLTQLHNKYSQLIPGTVDDPGYQNMINLAVAASGVKLISFTPGIAPTTGATASSSGVIPIPVGLNTSGTYDQEIRLIQLLYNLPRLTVITSINVSGGGPKTDRTTPLTVSYLMNIFETSAAPTTTTPTTATQ